jgi:amino acid permease
MFCSRIIATQTLNVFLTMVGAGVVALPLAFRAATLYVGCLTLFGAGMACVISMHTLTWLARRTLVQKKRGLLNNNPITYSPLPEDHQSDRQPPPPPADTSISSYDEICDTYLPAWGRILGQTTMFVLLFFVLALFVDVAHDSLSSTFHSLTSGAGYPLRGSICAVMCLFSIPTKLESLKYTSMFGFVSLSFLLGVIVYRCDQHMHRPNWVLPTHVPPVSFAGCSFATTVMLGAFAAAFNAVAAQAELPTDMQVQGYGSLIPLVAAGMALVFYVLFGITGYVALDGDPPRDILTGFSNQDALMSGARIAICAVSVFKAPLMANPLKAMIAHRLPCPLSSVGLTPLLYIVVFGISSGISDPSTVFGYVSAVGVNLTMFVIPGLCLRAVGQQAGQTHWVVYGWLMLLFGVGGMGVGLFSTIQYKPTSLVVNNATSPSSSLL